MKQKGFAPVLIILVIAILGVLGYAGYKQFILPNQSSNLPSSPTAPSNTPDVTAGWNAYKNNIYGIEFKIPTDWQISGGGENERITFGPLLEGSQIYDVSISLSDNPKNLPVGDYVTELINRSKEQPTTFMFNSKENISVGGKPAVILHSVFAFDRSLEEIFVANGNKIMIIGYPSNSENPNLLDPIKNYGIVQEILSTFKFTK